MPTPGEMLKQDAEDRKKLADPSGGWVPGSMPAEQPMRREGLPGMGFTDAELRKLHESAGTPRTKKRVYGPGEEKD